MITVGAGTYLTKTFFELLLGYGKDQYSSNELERMFEEVIEKSIQELIVGKGNAEQLKVFFDKLEVKRELEREGYIFQNITPIALYKLGEKFDVSSNEIDEFILFFKKNFYDVKEFEEILRKKKIEEHLGIISRYVKSIYELQTQNDNFDYNEFYYKYKTSMNLKIENIRYFGLGIECDQGIGKKYKKRGMKLEEIYVEPQFLLKGLKKDLTSLLNSEENLVILGGPGTGKSTFLKYVMYQFLKEDLLFKDTTMYRPIPVFIELKNYLKTIGEERSIKKYIIKNIQENSSSMKIELKDVELMIEKNLVTIFFDGLDEVFDVNLKMKIKEEIELLAKFHDNIKIIVTSRKEGYTEVAFEDEVLFVEAEILDFDNEKIDEYVEKWYLLEEESLARRKAKIIEFNNEKEKIDQTLLENPLLLSLIIILFTNNGEIPTTKLEIYESCTKTLVIDWENKKSLKLDLDERLLGYKENILVNLAYWQYCKSSEKNEKIVHYQVKKEVASIIQRLKLVDDEIQADRSSEAFLNYIQRRSIYFENNFTHKTFLEYYTALWIFKYYERKGKRDKVREIFLKYARNSYWNVVFELLMNMVDRDQGDTEIMDEYYEELIETDRETLPLLTRIMPTLKHISKDQIKKLYLTSIKTLLKEAEMQERCIYSGEKPLIFQIFLSSQESLKNKGLEKIFQETLDKVYESLPSEEARNYHILIKELNAEEHFGRDLDIKLIDNYEHNICNYMDIPLCYMHFKRKIGGNIKTEDHFDEFVERFSKERSFVEVPFLYIINRSYTRLIEVLFNNLIVEGKYDKIVEYFNKLEMTKKEILEMSPGYFGRLSLEMMEKRLIEIEKKVIEENGVVKKYFEKIHLGLINTINREKKFALKRG